MTRLLLVLGSLRAGSSNGALATALLELAPAEVELTMLPGIAALPFYNEDLDGGRAPDEIVRLRRAVAAADAVVIVSPEHNATMPATVKNVIDWASRPFGVSALTGKPVAVLGASPSRSGGAQAHHDIEKSLRRAGARVLEELTLSISTGGGSSLAADPALRARLAELIAEVTRGARWR